MMDKYLFLAATMLRMGADEFENHGCNDPDMSWYEGWTDEEKIAFVKGFNDYKGEAIYEEDPASLQWIGDSAVMGYLSHVLEMRSTVAEEKEPK